MSLPTSRVEPQYPARGRWASLFSPLRCRPGRGQRSTRGWSALLLLLACLLRTDACFGSAALLMEEPFGQFGAFNPTGHAAVYLNHVCADTPTHLRACEPGEHGVVISRYHKINHMDWLAIPLIPYLYSVDRMQDVPATMTEEEETALRAAYWREHLQSLAPGKPDGSPPDGEWIQLVGSSYDRKIHGFQVETTREQDERFIAIYNDKRNVSHFNLFFRNCADFSRVVLDTYFPGAVHRSFVADVGLMTPKQAAKSLVKYSRKHPELQMTTFVIEQVPGSLSRSHHVDGVEESLVRSKKYMVPLVLLTPHIATAAVVGYLTQGRMRLPKDAPVFEIDDAVPGANAERTTLKAPASDAPAVNVPAEAAPATATAQESAPS